MNESTEYNSYMGLILEQYDLMEIIFILTIGGYYNDNHEVARVRHAVNT